MNKTHHGMAAHEKFIGNCTRQAGIPQHLRQIESARLGSIAYDIHGKALDSHYAPLFITATDADRYEAIMMARYRAACRGE